MDRKSLYKEAQLELARRELARRSFVDYIQYVFPKYKMKWFHKLIAEKLDAVFRGEIKKLAIFIPPQHGKSELASRLFPTYVLGRDPTKKIALTSYGATLSEEFSRKVQEYFSSDEFGVLFPNLRLPSRGEAVRTGSLIELMERQPSGRWRKADGRVIAVGIGGGITGKTVDIGIIDDPIKGREAADSVSIRDHAWNWYIDELRTRLHNDASTILIQTRWHEDDVAGRALSIDGFKSESNPKGWDVVILPAIKTSDVRDYDPREEGDALWPERHNLERILEIKTQSIVTFDSLYQQDPKPNKETLIYPDWKEIPSFPNEREMDAVFYGLDFGYSNDPTALIKIGKQGRKIFLDEMIYERGLGPHALRKRMVELGVETNREIFADHNPAIIHDLKYPVNDKGDPLPNESFHILKAEKDILAGISTVKEFEIFYTARSLNIKMEKNKYSWRYVGGKNTNEPIDAWNHAMDAVRYGLHTKYRKMSSVPIIIDWTK